MTKSCSGPKETVGAIIISEGEEKILLLKRKGEPFAGKWCIPGGHIDPNETLEKTVGDALARA